MQPKPLRADLGNLKKLKEAGLELHPQLGSVSPDMAAQTAGQLFLFPTNNQKIRLVALELGSGNNPTTLTIRRDGVEQRSVCGHGDWVKGRMTFASDILRPPVEQPVAASGAWTADRVYRADLAFYETAFCVTITLQFSGDHLLYDSEYNVVRRGLKKLPQLVGQLH